MMLTLGPRMNNRTIPPNNLNFSIRRIIRRDLYAAWRNVLWLMPLWTLLMLLSSVRCAVWQGLDLGFWWFKYFVLWSGRLVVGTVWEGVGEGGL